MQGKNAQTYCQPHQEEKMNWVPGFNHDPCELQEARTLASNCTSLLYALLQVLLRHRESFEQLAGGLLSRQYLSGRQDPQWGRSNEVVCVFWTM